MAKESSTSKGGKKNNRWSQLLREFPQVETIAPRGAKSQARTPESSVQKDPTGRGPVETSSTGSSHSPSVHPPGAGSPLGGKSKSHPNQKGDPAAGNLSFHLDGEGPDDSAEEHVFSVSEINKAVKKQLEGNFLDLWLQGEISNFTAHTSGHFYFSLKDSKAQISAVMFRGQNSKLKFTPESGMEVLVRGRVTVYEPRGNYQFFCEHMEPVGAGALQKAFEQLKSKLQKEGLFDESRKQALPKMPQKVGVLTSPTGAAIRDILNVLGRRSPRVEVTVIPARVQGTVAAKEVAQGIALTNKVGGFDVLIVGRGGGSIEDLWCFNEEVVARAIGASKIPIISAVGHEIDFTIADFVADLRAPTPSAAAEVVAQSEEELKSRLQFSVKALRSMIWQKLSDNKNHLEFYNQRLKDPRTFLRDSVIRCDELTARFIQAFKSKIQHDGLRITALAKGLQSPKVVLDKARLKVANQESKLRSAMERRLTRSRQKWQQNSALLDSFSPLKVIDRGYAIVKSDKGQVVRSVNSCQVGQDLRIQVQDGTIQSKVIEIQKREVQS